MADRFGGGSCTYGHTTHVGDIVIVSGSYGAGHDAAADALALTFRSAGHTRHAALTYDDGPDPASNPAFVDLLDRLGVWATFFVLGCHLGDHGLLRETADAGHEVGIDGWDHRPVALRRPGGLRDDLVRTRDIVQNTTGTRVEFYRPPFGLMTTSSRWAAHAAGLRTVL